MAIPKARGLLPAKAGPMTPAPAAVAAKPAATPTVAPKAAPAPQIPAPAPLKAPTYVQKNQDPLAQMTRALKVDSPYMELAATEGAQAANKRGLLSSSMAVGAVADSRAKAALPLAQQAAQQNFQSNLSNQEFTQNRVIQGDQIASTERQQIRGIGADKETQLRGIAADKATQIRGITADKATQLRDIESKEGLAAAQRALDVEMQKRGLSAERQAQIREISSREGIAAAERALAVRQQNTALRADAQQRRLDRTQDRQQRALDRGLQEKLASWNLDSAQEQIAATMLGSATSLYEQSLAAINQNKNLKGKDRQAQIQALNARRDKNIALVRQILDVDISYPSEPAPTDKPDKPGKKK